MNSLATELHSETAPGWQQQLQRAIRSREALAEAIDLPADALPYSESAHASFPLLVPHAFASRMRRGDSNDPLLKQVLASPEEMQVGGEHGDYSRDPVGEIERYGGTPGVLQKYRGRALLVTTGQCAINCRYCFRRHYPYHDNALSSAARREAVADLLRDETLNELILSGGDPLLLPDRQLASIAEQLAAAERHVTLRIHTRLPIVIPDRVSDEMIAALSQPGVPIVMVLHCNHPNEIDTATHTAIGKLRGAGFTVLNQAVLLAGVNDTVDCLAQLSDRLFAAGAMPYYLHVLDKVAGAAHFDLPVSRARALVGELATQRPGYLVPKLMREVPGAESKREIAPLYESESFVVGPPAADSLA